MNKSVSVRDLMPIVEMLKLRVAELDGIVERENYTMAQKGVQITTIRDNSPRDIRIFNTWLYKRLTISTFEKSLEEFKKIEVARFLANLAKDNQYNLI